MESVRSIEHFRAIFFRISRRYSSNDSAHGSVNMNQIVMIGIDYFFCFFNCLQIPNIKRIPGDTDIIKIITIIRFLIAISIRNHIDDISLFSEHLDIRNVKRRNVLQYVTNVQGSFHYYHLQFERTFPAFLLFVTHSR